MKLSDRRIKNASTKDRMYRLYDGNGLYLQIEPRGGKYWRLKYRIQVGDSRKEKTLSIGTYPAISLSQAREMAHEARAELQNGEDPGLLKKARKYQQRMDRARNFAGSAEQWFEAKAPHWSQSHLIRQRRLLFVDLKPLHSLPLDRVNAAGIMQALQIMLDRGAVESAHRALSVARQVLDYACSLEFIPYNPAATLSSVLPKSKASHYAAPTTPADFRRILDIIRDQSTNSILDIAVRLCPLLLVRSSELRFMEWTEIGEDHIWRIPAAKMKRSREHWVPLSTQARGLIDLAKQTNANRRYVFASPTKPRQPISDNALRNRLRYWGITKSDASPHGFRASGRTLIVEALGYPKDIVEHQLAHKVREPDGRAYNRTEFLGARTGMMQHWSDYAEGLPMQSHSVPESQ